MKWCHSCKTYTPSRRLGYYGDVCVMCGSYYPFIGEADDDYEDEKQNRDKRFRSSVSPGGVAGGCGEGSPNIESPKSLIPSPHGKRSAYAGGGGKPVYHPNRFRAPSDSSGSDSSPIPGKRSAAAGRGSSGVFWEGTSGVGEAGGAGGRGGGGGAGASAAGSVSTPRLQLRKFLDEYEDILSGPFVWEQFKNKYMSYLHDRIDKGDRQTNAPKYPNFELPDEQMKVFCTFSDYLVYLLNLNVKYTVELLSFSILINSLCLIDIFLKKRGGVLNSKICHKLYASSLLASAKSLIDTPYNNKTYSTAFKFELPLLNFLEIAFLEETGYELYVIHEDFVNYVEMFKKRGCALK